MANEFKHKRYFRLINNEDSSKITFTSVEDAQTKIGFRDVWNTSSPTKTFALADADTTLIVTYEFDNKDDQDAFKAAVAVSITVPALSAIKAPKRPRSSFW